MQKGIKIISITAAIMVSGPALHAIDITSLTDSIIAHTPQKALNQARENAASAASTTVNNLNDPEVEFENVWGWKGIGNKLTLGVSQSFDWPSLYKARSAEARSLVNVARAEGAKELFDLRQQVSSTLVDIAYLNRQIELLDSLQQNYAQLVDAFDKSFKRGEINIVEVKKAQIELLNADTRLSEAKEQRSTLIGSLTTLTTYPACVSEALQMPLPPLLPLQSVDTYERLAQAHDPELLMCQAQLEQTKAATEVARKSGYPSFSVGYVYNYEFGDYFNGFSLGMTLPIFSNRHKTHAAATESEVVLAQTAQRQNYIKNEIRSLYQQATLLQEQVKQYNDILDDTSELRRLLKRSYDGGQMSLTDYLVDINSLNQGLLDRLNAEYRLHQVIFQLKIFE